MFYKHFVNCREKSRRVALDCKTFRLDSGLRFCVVPLALPRARNGRFWVLRSYRLNELEREVMTLSGLRGLFEPEGRIIVIAALFVPTSGGR